VLRNDRIASEESREPRLKLGRELLPPESLSEGASRNEPRNDEPAFPASRSDRRLSNERLGERPLKLRRLEDPLSEELPSEERPEKDRLKDDPPRAASLKEREDPPLNEREERSPPPLNERDESPLNDLDEWPDDMRWDDEPPPLNDLEEPLLKERDELPPPPDERLPPLHERPPSPRPPPPRPRPSSRSASASPQAINRVNRPTMRSRLELLAKYILDYSRFGGLNRSTDPALLRRFRYCLPTHAPVHEPARCLTG
jgi:hypothetical protein